MYVVLKTLLLPVLARLVSIRRSQNTRAYLHYLGAKNETLQERAFSISNSIQFNAILCFDFIIFK